MKVTGAYIYSHKEDTGEEIIDTWGVVAVGCGLQCFVLPDISVERAEAEAFALHIVHKEFTHEQLQKAACDYIETLYFL
ncbi:MAG: hypothetical protein IJO14_08710 [Clostridia bacterium]|nr:hypothetical protein [Clostridia bacterium]